MVTGRGRRIASLARSDEDLNHRRFDHSRRTQRLQSQDGGGRIAPRAGHEVRIPQRLPVQFRDSINEAAEKVRARMRTAIPTLVGGAVPQPKVGAQVNDPPGEAAEIVNTTGRLSVGQAQEEHVT